VLLRSYLLEMEVLTDPPQVPEQAREPPPYLIVYGSFENKVLPRFNLLEMEPLIDPLRSWDMVVRLDL
jgi:hypothetical protein